MSLTYTELSTRRLSRRAAQALVVARARAQVNARATASAVGGTLDTRCLLVGLAEDPSLWPAGTERTAQAVRDRVLGRSTEPPSETLAFRGARVSEELVNVLTEAHEIADDHGSDDVRSEHLLFALSQSIHAEATALLRSASGERDPWASIVRQVGSRLERQETTPARLNRMAEGRAELAARPVAYERTVALLYMLARDEVPFGKLTTITGLLGDSAGRFDFTNKHVEALARDLADRLWG